MHSPPPPGDGGPLMLDMVASDAAPRTSLPPARDAMKEQLLLATSILIRTTTMTSACCAAARDPPPVLLLARPGPVMGKYEKHMMLIALSPCIKSGRVGQEGPEKCFWLFEECESDIIGYHFMKKPSREELHLVRGPCRAGAAARVLGGFVGTGDLADFWHTARGQGSLLGARYVDGAWRRLHGGVARGVGAMATEGREGPARLG
ncbi:uncharacterized protein [Triticum aestivum]|uniref:uncharacterized protein isoform X2 n=1 Tax=Triticum aestivum TaxID=4565 RepID=UPI001D01E9E2|nr:uncharacterized protein LOC123190094 isoform X2 [Triticum aestivum]